MYYCEYSFFGLDRLKESAKSKEKNDIFAYYYIFAFDSKKSRDEYVAKHEFFEGRKITRAINAEYLRRVAGKNFNLSRMRKNDFYSVVPENGYRV